MNDKIKLPKGFVYAYFTLFPKQDTHCYTSSKSNKVEQESLAMSGTFSVYDPSTKKRLGSTDDGLIYTFWLNDASPEDIKTLEDEYPTVIMCTSSGTIYTERADVPSTSDALPTGQSAEISV
jgi:hypothetical protein